MPPYIWHLVAWWMLLAVFPLVWALRAHSALRRDERMYQLAFVVSPVLLGVIWLHGLLFVPPDNWAPHDAINVLAFWFRPHELPFYVHYRNQLLVLAVPGVATASFLAYRGAKVMQYAWNRRTAAISYVLQVGAWLLLRHLAELLIGLGDALTLRSFGWALWIEATRIAIAVCVPLPLIIIAFMFKRQSLEARPTAA